MSTHAVVGSGMTSMSEAAMPFQPRIEEPSKPRPSVKISSLYSLSVVVKCCQVPRRSQNLKSTSLIPWSLTILDTSDGLKSLGMVLSWFGGGWVFAHRGPSGNFFGALLLAGWLCAGNRIVARQSAARRLVFRWKKNVRFPQLESCAAALARDVPA